MTANPLHESDRREPTLVVKYGNTAKKHFALNKFAYPV